MRGVRERAGRALLGLLRYRVEGRPPAADGACVVVAAPHTSWLDFPIMLGIAWSNGMRLGFLAKKELFRAPFGTVMRRLGGIEVDRDRPGTLVADLASRARTDDPFALVVAPEGTRARARTWKSGFYRIAREAGVPLVLAFVDGPTRTCGFGPTFLPTGDVVADMDVLRAFYADKRGVRPDRATPPRLGEEERGAPPAPPEEPAAAG